MNLREIYSCGLIMGGVVWSRSYLIWGFCICVWMRVGGVSFAEQAVSFQRASVTQQRAPVVLSVWEGMIVVNGTQHPTPDWTMNGMVLIDDIFIVDKDGWVQTNSVGKGQLAGWVGSHTLDEGIWEEIFPTKRAVSMEFLGEIPSGEKFILGLYQGSFDQGTRLIHTGDGGTIPFASGWPFLGQAFMALWPPPMLPQIDLSIESNGMQGVVASGQMEASSFGMGLPGNASINVFLKSGPFDIRDIVPSVFGTFVGGISVDNTVKTLVDWRYEDPKTVEFKLHQRQDHITADEEGGENDYNMGDLNAAIGGGNNRIKSTAEAKSGNRSKPDFRDLDVIPKPGWALALAMGEWEAQVSGSEAIYSLDFQFPAKPFNAKEKVPSGVPYLGGYDLGLLDSQAEMSAWVSSMGQGLGTAKGSTGFTAAGVEIKGEIKGNSILALDTGGLRLNNGEIEITVQGTIVREEDLFVLFPLLKGRVQRIWGIGQYLSRVGKLIKVKGEVGPVVGLGASFAQQGESIEWTGGKGSAGITLGIEASLGDAAAVQAVVGGVGTVTVNFKLPPPVYDDVSGKIKIFAKLLYKGYMIANPAKEWTWGGAGKTSLGVLDERYLWVPYTFSPEPINNYAGWQGGLIAERPASRYLMQGGRRLDVVTQWQLVSNIGSDASSAIASNAADNLAVVWIQEDLSKPLDQRREVWASLGGGGVWSTAERITMDDLDAFNPSVVMDMDGDVVAVWEGPGPGSMPAQAFDSDYLKRWEIWASHRNAVTGEWDTPQKLTDDDAFDMDPKIVRRANDSFLVVWKAVRDEGTSATIALRYAKWTGAAWSASADIVVDQGIGGFDVAADSLSGKAWVVYDSDIDGDPETLNDTEIFTHSYASSVWTAPQRLTSNEVVDFSPRVVSQGEGVATVVWYHDGDLVLSSADGVGQSTVLPGQGNVAFRQMQCGALDNGHLVLVWQDYSQHVSQLFRKVVSLDKPLQGTVLPITSGVGRLEGAPALTVLQENNALGLSYLSTVVQSSVTTVSLGQTDLMALEHVLLPDFSFDAVSSFTLQPENPRPGEAVKIALAIWNTGDFGNSTQGLRVSLWDGEPGEAGSRKIREVTWQTPLSAGTSRTQTFDWTVPAGDQPHHLVAVLDQNNQIDELNEDNNRATLYTVLPDLVLARFAPQYIPGGDIEFEIAVRNGGAVPNVQSYKAVVSEVSTRKELVFAEIPAGIPVDSVFTTKTRITRSHMESECTSVVLCGVVSADPLPEREMSLDNNSSLACVRIRPDLYLTGGFAVVQPPLVPGGQHELRIPLWNLGAWEVPAGVVVHLFLGDPWLGGRKIAETRSNAPISPGHFETLSVMLDLPQDWELYLVVDPFGEIAEIDKGNNLTFLNSRGQSSTQARQPAWFLVY